VGASEVVPQVATASRSVVYTAEVVVRVEDTSEATTEALDLVKRAGGYLFAQQTQAEGSRESQLTLKVPSDRFDSVLDGLAGLAGWRAEASTPKT